MRNFIHKHIHKLLFSVALLGVLQFLGQVSDYLSDGQLDFHEIQQLIMSCTSGAQTIIILTIVIFIKLEKEKK